MQQTEVKQPTKQTNSKQELKSNSNIRALQVHGESSKSNANIQKTNYMKSTRMISKSHTNVFNRFHITHRKLAEVRKKMNYFLKE